MQNSKSFLSDDIAGKLDRLIFDYYFSLSSIAASKGKYGLANNYLSELLKINSESSLVFDLQAKIAAQQGKFREAEFLWKQCLKIEPDNHDYIAALNRINQLQSSKASRFLFFWPFAFKVVAVLLLLFMVIFFVNELKLLHDQLNVINLSTNALTTQVESLAVSEEPNKFHLMEIESQLRDFESLTLIESSGEIKIIFNDGLFRFGNRMRNDQIELLNTISKVFSPHAGKIIVTIIGSSDDIPVSKESPFKNNEELSLSRAKTVFDYVYSNSRIPREDFRISSLSEFNSFFPNDSPENRLKNRTVMISITKK